MPRISLKTWEKAELSVDDHIRPSLLATPTWHDQDRRGGALSFPSLLARQTDGTINEECPMFTVILPRASAIMHSRNTKPEDRTVQLGPKTSRSPYNYIDRLPMDKGSCKPACKVHTDSMQAQPACSTREDPWDDGSNCNAADQPRLDRSNGQEGRCGLSVWCSSVGGFNRLLQPQSAAAISITNTSF